MFSICKNYIKVNEDLFQVVKQIPEDRIDNPETGVETISCRTIKHLSLSTKVQQVQLYLAIASLQWLTIHHGVLAQAQHQATVLVG